MKRLIPFRTSSQELSDVLSSDSGKVAGAYSRLAEIEKSAASDNQKSKQCRPELKRLCSAEFNLVESASLRLHKFVHLGADCKNEEMHEVCKRVNHNAGNIRKKALWNLPNEMVSGTRELPLKLEGRLALHLAGGILENAGICIHPHFNCPYIPGSGVKGVARHAAWLRWKSSKSVEDAMKVAWVFGFPTGDSKPRKGSGSRSDDEYLDDFLKSNRPELFGEKGKYATFAGMVAFLPAMPVEGKYRAVTDIVTCHHPKYYTGRKARATDDESPNPQFFPVIERGSLFRFLLKPVRTSVADDMPKLDAVMDWAVDFLREGMTLLGAGAKTSAGYGWFSVDEKALREAAAAREEQEAEAREKRRLQSMTPVERAMEQLRSSEDFGSAVNAVISGSDEDEQNALLLLLHGEKSEEWKSMKKRAKKKPKVQKRVDALLELSRKLGKELS